MSNPGRSKWQNLQAMTIGPLTWFFHQGPSVKFEFIFSKFTISSNSMMITKSIHFSYDEGIEIQKEIERQTI
jgi:hypothetical protein